MCWLPPNSVAFKFLLLVTYPFSKSLLRFPYLHKIFNFMLHIYFVFIFIAVIKQHDSLNVRPIPGWGWTLIKLLVFVTGIIRLKLPIPKYLFLVFAFYLFYPLRQLVWANILPWFNWFILLWYHKIDCRFEYTLYFVYEVHVCTIIVHALPIFQRDTTCINENVKWFETGKTRYFGTIALKFVINRLSVCNNWCFVA